MAAGLSPTKANEFLDNMCNAGSVTSVTALYIKLHLGDPGLAGAGNPAANTTRVSASMAAAASGAITNDAAITWTSVPSTETYSHISAWDHLTSGTFLFSDALASSRAVTAGDNFQINTGDLDISLTPLSAA
jgi:hypothetical protein